MNDTKVARQVPNTWLKNNGQGWIHRCGSSVKRQGKASTPHPPILVNPKIRNALVSHFDESDLTTTKWKFETGKSMRKSLLPRHHT
jgi:hypothetical protein